MMQKQQEQIISRQTQLDQVDEELEQLTSVLITELTLDTFNPNLRAICFGVKRLSRKSFIITHSATPFIEYDFQHLLT